MLETSKFIDYSILVLIGLFIVGKANIWFKLKKSKAEIVEKQSVWNGFFALAAFFIGVTHGWEGGMKFGHCELHGPTGHLGLLFVLVGVALNFFAERSLGEMWHMDAVIYGNHRIVKSGPYAWCSHPIYLAEFLILFGMAFHSMNMAGFLFVALFLFEIRMRSRTETNLLMKHFPDEYGAYLAKDTSLGKGVHTNSKRS